MVVCVCVQVYAACMRAADFATPQSMQQSLTAACLLLAQRITRVVFAREYTHTHSDIHTENTDTHSHTLAADRHLVSADAAR